jgi:hypothetical protein
VVRCITALGQNRTSSLQADGVRLPPKSKPPVFAFLYPRLLLHPARSRRLRWRRQRLRHHDAAGDRAGRQLSGVERRWRDSHGLPLLTIGRAQAIDGGIVFQIPDSGPVIASPLSGHGLPGAPGQAGDDSGVCFIHQDRPQSRYVTRNDDVTMAQLAAAN